MGEEEEFKTGKKNFHHFWYLSQFCPANLPHVFGPKSPKYVSENWPIYDSKYHVRWWVDA